MDNICIIHNFNTKGKGNPMKDNLDIERAFTLVGIVTKKNTIQYGISIVNPCEKRRLKSHGRAVAAKRAYDAPLAVEQVDVSYSELSESEKRAYLYDRTVAVYDKIVSNMKNVIHYLSHPRKERIPLSSEVLDSFETTPVLKH